MADELYQVHEVIPDDNGDIYSDTVIDHAVNPRNVGEIYDADGYGSAVGICGDDMEIWLRISNGIITEARFWTSGCSTTIASGSMVTEMAKGKAITQAQKINQHDIVIALEGLPEGSEHCAQLAANSLKEAKKDYLELRRDPWKEGRFMRLVASILVINRITHF